jgi:hypothetical protein
MTLGTAGVHPAAAAAIAVTRGIGLGSSPRAPLCELTWATSVDSLLPGAGIEPGSGEFIMTGVSSGAAFVLVQELNSQRVLITYPRFIFTHVQITVVQ